MEVVFEKASGKDVEVILSMLIELYTELGEERESLTYLSGDLVTLILESRKTEIYLVKENNKVVGIFTLTESQAIYAGGKYGVIDEMYIEDSYRGKNIGKEIIRFTSAIARNKGWFRVDVTAPTEEKSDRAKKFYRNNGFVFTGPKYKLYIEH